MQSIFLEQIYIVKSALGDLLIDLRNERNNGSLDCWTGGGRPLIRTWIHSQIFLANGPLSQGSRSLPSNQDDKWKSST